MSQFSKYAITQVPDLDKMVVEQRVILGCCLDLRVVAVVSARSIWVNEEDLVKAFEELTPGYSSIDRASFWVGVATGVGLIEVEMLDSSTSRYRFRRIKM